MEGKRSREVQKQHTWTTSGNEGIETTEVTAMAENREEWRAAVQ